MMPPIVNVPSDLDGIGALVILGVLVICVICVVGCAILYWKS